MKIIEIINFIINFINFINENEIEIGTRVKYKANIKKCKI